MFTFVGEAIRNYRWTGALAPSTPRLARAMTTPARQATGRKRVLEVGPGTGPFTRPLLRTLNDGDELHIVEINPRFCERLDQSILAPYRRAHPDRMVQLHCGPIQAVPLEGRFDFIVCSLPFNIFPLVTVREIFRRMIDLLDEGGELTYFEYAGMTALKVPIVGPAGRRSLRHRTAIKKVLNRRLDGRRRLVWGNLPPAYAMHLRNSVAN